MQQTTIAAIATPTGMGGIGIVRLSGPDSREVAKKIFRPCGKKDLENAEGYTGMLGRIFDKDGDLDDAIVFVYRSPFSYTGEDVVELCCHGGSWIVRAVLRLCLANGAVAAGPGEFTRRAFENGKLGLSQAEAIMNLIEARNKTAMRTALAARDGRLSAEIEKIVEALLYQASHLAAWTDYPEEDMEEVSPESLNLSLEDIQKKIALLLHTWDTGHLVREGVPTVIVGRPNVGKSTLMNLLAGYDRSIVTDIPGTTRDLVEDSVQLGEVILHLIDTAGLRITDDPVEQIGVNRAKNQVETAELVLAVFDSSDTLDASDMELIHDLQGRRWIAVLNKIDCPTQFDIEAIAESAPQIVQIAAKTGDGKEDLEKAVAKVLQLDKVDPNAATVFNERQRSCLMDAQRALEEAITAAQDGWTLDAIGVSIDAALDSLLALNGQKVTEEVVDQVFARFCVGK